MDNIQENKDTQEEQLQEKADQIIKKENDIFEQIREKKTDPSVAETLKIIGKRSKDIVLSDFTSREEVTDALEPVQEEIIGILMQNEVPISELKHWKEKTIATVAHITNGIEKVVGYIEDEYLSRTLESRNPKTNKYAKEYATISLLWEKLKDKRKDQENDPDGYFYTENKAETKSKNKNMFANFFSFIKKKLRNR